MSTLSPKLPWDHPYAANLDACSGYQSVPTDPDAIDYLTRVAAADGSGVEVGVAMAVDQFVKGCKADGIWDAIKSACIMCGARTLSGALVSLRQYGPELWDSSASPTVADNFGSSGSYDIATRTMSNLSAGTNNSYPRFQFNTIGVTIGITYAVSGQLTGDLSSLNNIRFGPGSTLTFDQSTGVISGTATASQAFLEFLIDGTVAPSSVRIESLSIKEVINDAENVANNFVEADYDRSGGGLKGDGATKYLDSNRADNADPQNSKHLAIYATEAPSADEQLIGALTSPSPVIGSQLAYSGTDLFVRANQEFSTSSGVAPGVGFHAVNRSSSSGIDWRLSGVVNAAAAASSESGSGNVWIYSRNYAGASPVPTTARLAFYSIGSALDLAALDNRVSTLITAISAAI